MESPASTTRRIESYVLSGPAGNLEALLEEPEGRETREAVVVCHPHPLYGGTMHNKVVYRTARGLRRSGSVVLRFNFRCVGRSEGRHAGGIGEYDDAGAALDWLRARYPELPYSIAGFSFGSRIALKLGCSVTGISRTIAIGFPTRNNEVDYLTSCPAPKIFIQSTRDEHGPRPEMEAIYAKAAEPKQIHWIESADHFFADALDRLEETVFRLDRPHLNRI